MITTRENDVTLMEEQQCQNRDSESISMNKNLLTDICQSSSLFIFLFIMAIIPVLQVVVGLYYSNDCPIDQLIPRYLIVAGVVGLLIVLLISLTQLMSRTFARKLFDNVTDRTNSNQATMLVGCGVCSIMCINLSLFTFLLGWSVAGWIWVTEVWHRVQYNQVQSIDYCHPILYHFAFSLLLITTIFKIIFFCFVCRKTCVRVTNFRKKDSVTSLDL